MMKRHHLFLLLLAAVLALSGCGPINRLFHRGSSNIQPPKPLEEFTPTLQVNELWSTDIGDGAGNSGTRLRPAYADGKLYLISTDGRIEALDATSGATIWRDSGSTGDDHGKAWPDDARYAGGPTVADGLLVVGTLDGHVLAFDASNGKRLWSAQVDNEVISPPAIGSGLVFVRTNSGYVYAFDAHTGKRKWLNDQTVVPLLSLRGNGPLLASHGVLMFGTDAGNVVALRADSGIVLWKLALGKHLGRTAIQKLNDSDGSLQLDGSTLYATAYHGELAAIDAAQVRKLWSRSFSSYVGVGVASKEVVGVDADSVVWAFAKRGGGDLWKQDALKYHWLTAPAIQNHYAVVGGIDGYIHWLDLSDGKLAARVHMSGDPIRARPVVHGDTIYVEDVAGHVTAYQIQPSA